MVSVVVVSHSRSVADGIVELARQMGGDDVTIEAAGGADGGDAIGTDALAVMEAIERADGGGVLVLMDLGSAVLSAEMALDMLPEEIRARVRLCAAPVVEGAIGAVTAARMGQSLDEVAAEAERGLEPKRAHLGDEPAPSTETQETMGPPSESQSIVLSVTNELGLHARPAALFVRTVGEHDAVIEVSNVTLGKGPVSGRSLSAVATLGVGQGHDIHVRASGPAAADALRALEELAKRGFGDEVGATEVVDVAVVETPARPRPSDDAAEHHEGIAVSPGLALGGLSLFHRALLEVPDHAGEYPDQEWASLRQALDATKKAIEGQRDALRRRAAARDIEIFDAHLMIVDDDMLLNHARRGIDEKHKNAARAYADAIDDAVEQFRAMSDDYLSARADDVSDIGRQVLELLLGVESSGPLLTRAGVLVAPDLAPADTATLDPDKVLGIATAFGGPTSHSAILARSLGVPAVAGLGEDVLALSEGTEVLLDGDLGVLYVEPGPELCSSYEERTKRRAELARIAEASSGEPATTTDGHRVEVAGNAGRAADARAIVEAGGEGIGLFRTEFLYMERDDAPSEEEQVEAYSEAADSLEGRPLVLRTLDVGADKPLRFAQQPPEENPFLGRRGLRFSLAEPELLRTQLRAALRVAEGHDVRVMFPMVTTVGELSAAQELVDESLASLESEGRRARRPAVGIMVEVPAAALIAPALAAECDFFSIGTNDLTQYALAADRGNDRVANLADAAHPAVLQLIDRVCRGAQQSDTHVAVCGEAAADPVVAPLLVGLGVQELSLAAPSIPLIKLVVRRMSLQRVKQVAAEAVSLATAVDVRALVATRLPEVTGAFDVGAPAL